MILFSSSVVFLVWKILDTFLHLGIYFYRKVFL